MLSECLIPFTARISDKQKYFTVLLTGALRDFRLPLDFLLADKKTQQGYCRVVPSQKPIQIASDQRLPAIASCPLFFGGQRTIESTDVVQRNGQQFVVVGFTRENGTVAFVGLIVGFLFGFLFLIEALLLQFLFVQRN